MNVFLRLMLAMGREPGPEEGSFAKELVDNQPGILVVQGSGG